MQPILRYTVPVPAAVVSVPRRTHAAVLKSVHCCLKVLFKSSALSNYACSAGAAGAPSEDLHAVLLQLMRIELGLLTTAETSKRP
jgi:hypothetical protein